MFCGDAGDAFMCPCVLLQADLLWAKMAVAGLAQYSWYGNNYSSHGCCCTLVAALATDDVIVGLGSIMNEVRYHAKL